jgi:outer membrane protein assembly factor BamA
VPRNRYGGNTKALGNVELRWAAVEIPWGPAPLQIGLSGFYDTGRVWQPGQANGKFFDSNQWHSGAGGGLRLMRRAAVIRADFGFDLDTKRTGIYVAFGQLF